MRLIETEITIPAPAEQVWATLIAFDTYENWNPFIVRGRGRAVVGERLELTMQPKGKKAIVFKPIVTIVTPQRHLQWLGHLLVPGVFDGRHEFLLEPNESSTRVVQRETFTGILPVLMGKQLDFVEENFNAFNAALRQRVCS